MMDGDGFSLCILDVYVLYICIQVVCVFMWKLQ